MFKKFVIWLLTISLVIITVGCTSINQQSQSTLSNLLITPDSSGGIFAAYRLVGTTGDNSVKLQRINSEGTTAWNSTLYETDNSRVNIMEMIKGTSNEVLIGWEVLNPDDDMNSYSFDHSSLAKVDSQG